MWLASRCEAFPGRFLSEILAEEERLPVGLVDEVLEAKAYMHAKGMTDAADTPAARKQLPTTPLFALVKEIEFDLAEEEMHGTDG